MKVSSIKQKIIYIFLVLIIGIFPLCYRQSYQMMDEVKYNFFLYSAVACISMLILASVVQFFFTDDPMTLRIKGCAGLVDASVLIYFGIVVLSYICSPYKQYLLFGSSYWYMGLVTQLLFLLTYIFISRDYIHREWVLYVLYGASGIVFLLGVLHRFLIDPLDIYNSMYFKQKQMFLSTIGQSSWYSSYLCTVMPLGLYDYFSTDDIKRKKWLLVYLVLSFSSLVTQNSDSAYISLAGMLLLLLYLGSKSHKGMIRFWEIMVIMFASFKITGVIQIMRGFNAIITEPLSHWMSQSLETWVLLLICICVYIYFKRKEVSRTYNYLFYIAITLTVLAILFLISLIVINTMGLIPRINTSYLIWNDYWGNFRGISWRVAVESYAMMHSPIHYLIGMGPDSFEVHTCTITSIAEQLDAFWGATRLTNAHNDYLTTLVNYGALGLISYLWMFVCSVKIFVRDKHNKILPGLGICILAYALHNFFCYQEICNAPYVYIFLGMGVNLLQKEEI